MLLFHLIKFNYIYLNIYIKYSYCIMPSMFIRNKKKETQTYMLLTLIKTGLVLCIAILNIKWSVFNNSKTWGYSPYFKMIFQLGLPVVYNAYSSTCWVFRSLQDWHKNTYFLSLTCSIDFSPVTLEIIKIPFGDKLWMGFKGPSSDPQSWGLGYTP